MAWLEQHPISGTYQIDVGDYAIMTAWWGRGISDFAAQPPIGPIPLPGDFNNDGSVNAADYVVWRKNPGGFPANTYSTWRLYFGQRPAAARVQWRVLPCPSRQRW